MAEPLSKNLDLKRNGNTKKNGFNIFFFFFLDKSISLCFHGSFSVNNRKGLEFSTNYNHTTLLIQKPPHARVKTVQQYLGGF